jgi:hypothetical protein
VQKRSTLWGVKGSVWERGDGRFAAAYPVPVPGGTKRKTTTKRNEDEGWAWVAEMERIYGGDEPTVLGAQSVGQYLNYYVAAIGTGLRPGEMLGLKWGTST